MATIYRGNDTTIKTATITDINGAQVTAGTVTAEILTPDGATSLIASAAATHDGSGVWSRALTAAQIDTIPAAWNFVLQQFVFGSPTDATFEEIIKVAPREG